MTLQDLEMLVRCEWDMDANAQVRLPTGREREMACLCLKLPEQATDADIQRLVGTCITRHKARLRLAEQEAKHAEILREIYAAHSTTDLEKK